MSDVTLVDVARNKAREKFLKFFPGGFDDEKYISWERGYKWNAHLLWKKLLNKKQFSALLKQNEYNEIAKIALYIEGKTNLLFSFEKMAIRDALKTLSATKKFSEGLYNLLYGKGEKSARFNDFIQIISSLPRKQTRVLTWPLVTVFGFMSRQNDNVPLRPK